MLLRELHRHAGHGIYLFPNQRGPKLPMSNPAAQGFRRTADLDRDGFDRCPLRAVLLAASLTKRTARSITSGEYLGCFFMTPFSQTMEPLQDPGRFMLGNFAAYGSFEESLNAHNQFLIANRRYQTHFESRDPLTWAMGLQAKGYATDPQYATKLISVMKAWNLK